MVLLSRKLIIAPLAVLLSVGLQVSFACQDLAKAPHFNEQRCSLDFIPANAAFYWSSQNHRQIWKLLVESPAVNKLLETRAAGAVWRSFKDGFAHGLRAELNESTLNAIDDWLRSELGEDSLKLLFDSISEEVFVFGDDNFSELMASGIRFYGKAFRSGLGSSKLGENEVRAQLAHLAAESFAEAQIPSMLVGGRLSDVGLANDFMHRAHARFNSAMKSLPAEWEFLKTALKKHVSEDGIRLSLKFNFDDLPWEKFAAIESTFAGDAESFRSWGHGRSVTVTLGVVRDYLVVAVAPNDEFIARLGTGSLLIDNDVFRTLRELGERPWTTITYLSDEFVASTSNAVDFGEYYNHLFQAVRRDSSDWGGRREFANAIESDLADFSTELRQWFPKPGAYLEYSFLTDHGIEGFSYDWSENTTYDGSRPLTVLNHVGGSPALLIAARRKRNPASTDIVEKYVTRLFQRVHEFAPDFIESPRQLEHFQSFMSQLREIFSALNRIHRQKLLPSIADGQSAFIVDFKLTREQWFVLMPPANQPLPIPSFGGVMTLSDMDLFKDAVSDYLEQADRLIEILKSLPDSNIPPNFRITRPDQKPLGDGTIYSYGGLVAAGFHEDLLPNLSINQRLVAITLSEQHSRRLLDPTPLEIGGPLGDPSRSLMFAVHYDNRATMLSIEKWVNYAILVILGDTPAEDFCQFPTTCDWKMAVLSCAGMALIQEPKSHDAESLGLADILELTETTFEMLSCFRSYTAVGYEHEGIQVTHYLYRFGEFRRESD